MVFDLAQRTASFSVGEFSAFTTGPRGDSGGGFAGVWRAQLGTHWHNELRAQATADTPGAEFEIPITGRVFHHGWTLTLGGRIDQLIRQGEAITLREIKTVTRALPVDESELRRDYPEYFAQLAAYGSLVRSGALGPPSAASDQLSAISGPPAEAREQIPAGEPRVARLAASQLIFVEVGSGLAQTIVLTPADEAFFRIQLERVVEFLEHRRRARERLRHLAFRPAFATPRPGQETTGAELTALFAQHPLVFFEAPTGFGKTGVLLEFALGQLRSGHFDRVLYLTSKATGQIQVVRTLAGMTEPGAGGTDAITPVTAWHVRNKAEHCVNQVFHCTRDTCAYLAGAEERWPKSGLARFYLDDRQRRDLDALRAAGRDARICPYEITRAALAFNDVWIGDYNYVFAPRNRSLFYEQPGFDAARTLLLVDEAHNLPARVADAYSQDFSAVDAYLVRDELKRIHASGTLATAWDHWCHFLQHLRPGGRLAAADEDDARHLLAEIARLLPNASIDFAAIEPRAAELVWSVSALTETLQARLADLAWLWWCPREAELAITCLDAAPAIGATLREFGGVVLASATLSPPENFAAACGLDAPPVPPPPNLTAQPTPAPARLGALTKRATRKLYTQLTTAADLLRVEEAAGAAAPALLRAHTPWRDGAYDIAFDARVDTTFQHRTRFYPTTAATIAALCAAASASRSIGPEEVPTPGRPTRRAVAVFFPSYAYAETIAGELELIGPGLRVALQPRLPDLAAQSAWVEESLLLSDALFLVLGSSFAESIDLLGGRIGHAMVVGPALPEVNAVQRARLAEFSALGREAAFRRVYQIPGMTKVNQALGRLVRAPGQRARVILHCRRFLDPTYASLLATEYQLGTNLETDDDLAGWLASGS